MTFIDSSFEQEPWENVPTLHAFAAMGFPKGHPAEAGLFARQLGVPGHDQALLDRARVVMVGAGGLGSWVGLALVRSGVYHLTVIDRDRFERGNAHRQLVFADDLGRPKASALARNLRGHMIDGGLLQAIDMDFSDAVERFEPECEIVVALVDNNRCRLAASRWARARRIPAVFAMLSPDAMRLHVFLQGGELTDACLGCAFPDLNPEASMPCASGVISTCFMAAAHATFFAYRALMGWPEGVAPFNWCAVDLLTDPASSRGRVAQRDACALCGPGFAD